MLLIPAIDLKDGLCVRLKQGRMEDDTVFSDSPLDMAGHWVALGTQRLHLVDLNGAFAGKPVNGEIIKAISQRYPNLTVQAGGGVRELATIGGYLEAGVDFVIIGTQAVKEPDFVKRACAAYPGHIMVGIDAKNGNVATDGWAKDSGVSAKDLARQFAGEGVSAIVYTDISRDGMLTGPNLEATADLADGLGIPVIASGGIGNLDDVRAVKALETKGIAGAITGRAIYEGALDFAEALKVAEG